MMESKQENDQNQTNSLLRTAATTKLGAGKMAASAFRSGVPPPVRPTSDESKVTETEGAIKAEEKEVTVTEEAPQYTSDAVVESSIPEEKEEEKPVLPVNQVLQFFLGSNSKTPRAVIEKTTQPPQDLSNVEMRPMQIQKGIHFSGPSPLSLDRVQVQDGQEHALPESKEARELKEKAEREEEEAEREKTESLKETEILKAIEAVERQLRNEVQRERGEGFGADIVEPTIAIETAGKETIKKKVVGTPEQVAEARILARLAILAAKASKFPVSEIVENNDDDVSALGCPQTHQHVLSQPVDDTNALIDLVETAEDATEAGLFVGVKNGINGITSKIDCTMGAMYLEDLLGTLTGAGNKIALNNILNDKDVQLRLSEMNFDADVFQSCSPRSNGSMPALEKEVIDLTQVNSGEFMLQKLGNPMSRMTPAPIDTVEHDRYAVEAEESPRHFSKGEDELSAAASGDFASGMICGAAAPLYLLYSSKTKEAANQLKIAAIKDFENLQQQAVAVCSPVGEKKNEFKEEELSEIVEKKNRVLLEDNDIYWDTLSTIASTKGMDYEKFVPTFATHTPGPIPIEIRMDEEEASNKDTATESQHAKLPVASPRKTEKSEPIVLNVEDYDPKQTTFREWGKKEIHEAPESGSFDYKQEQELLSKTLQLSKDLLASLAEQEFDAAEDDEVNGLLSFGTNDGSDIVPIDAEKLLTEKRQPETMSKLDVLRAQRAQAMARFQSSRVPEMPAVSTVADKAEELRRQIDEALVASREIRKSQEKLGDDLNDFKSKYGEKNDELEDQEAI